MTKKELRNFYREKRISISILEKDKMEDLMLIEFQKLGLTIPDVIMTYAPGMKHAEFDPVLVERYCMFRNPAVSFAYPVVNDAGYMDAVLPDEETVFQPNRYGIDEPVGAEVIEPGEVEMVFIPLLAFDEKGFRVGYGKGYYDRFLKSCHKDVVKIGFSFFKADIIDDLNEHDVPMDFCITPAHCYKF